MLIKKCQAFPILTLICSIDDFFELRHPINSPSENTSSTLKKGLETLAIFNPTTDRERRNHQQVCEKVRKDFRYIEVEEAEPRSEQRSPSS